MSNEKMDESNEEARASLKDQGTEITDDSDLQDEIQEATGVLDNLDDYADDSDWQNALEQADQLQEIVNRIHAYVAGRAK
jgi:hypothetical protein